MITITKKQEHMFKYLDELLLIKQIKFANPVQNSQEKFDIQYMPKFRIHSQLNGIILNLIVIIPLRFPQVPPNFISHEHIHHLNIDPNDNTFLFSEIDQDWTPFLTLKEVFEALARILQEPDQRYPSCRQILLEYKNNRKWYQEKRLKSLNSLKKVDKNVIKMPQARLKREMNQKLVQRKINFTETDDIKKSKENDIQDYENLKKEIIMSDKVVEQKKLNRIWQEKGHVNAHSIYVDPKNSEVKHIQKKLEKINYAIQVIISEINFFQRQLQRQVSSQVRKILQIKLDQQMKALNQLCATSTQYKNALMNSIQQQAVRNSRSNNNNNRVARYQSGFQ